MRTKNIVFSVLAILGFPAFVIVMNADHGNTEAAVEDAMNGRIMIGASVTPTDAVALLRSTTAGGSDAVTSMRSTRQEVSEKQDRTTIGKESTANQRQ